MKAEALQLKQIAKVEADNAWRSREAELQKELEQKKMFTETEKLRAIELSKAKVMAEAAIERAKGEAMAVTVRPRFNRRSQFETSVCTLSSVHECTFPNAAVFAT